MFRHRKRLISSTHLLILQNDSPDSCTKKHKNPWKPYSQPSCNHALNKSTISHLYNNSHKKHNNPLKKNLSQLSQKKSKFSRRKKMMVPLNLVSLTMWLLSPLTRRKCLSSKTPNFLRLPSWQRRKKQYISA